MTDIQKQTSTITNCLIEQRRGDPTLFTFDKREDGLCRVHLDGYAIVPLEDYHALLLKGAPLWKRLAIRLGLRRMQVGEKL